MSDLFFGINMQKLLREGVLDLAHEATAPSTPPSELSSEELLFSRLWASDMMHSRIFHKGECLVQQGQGLE